MLSSVSVQYRASPTKVGFPSLLSSQEASSVLLAFTENSVAVNGHQASFLLNALEQGRLISRLIASFRCSALELV